MDSEGGQGSADSADTVDAVFPEGEDPAELPSPDRADVLSVPFWETESPKLQTEFLESSVQICGAHWRGISVMVHVNCHQDTT